jgi:hypothetical protein
VAEDQETLERRALESALRELVGLRLSGSHRAVDLEAFLIGDTEERIDRRGRRYEASAYSLHVQSPWRITAPRGIVVGYRDVMYPRSGVSDEQFDPDEIGLTRREDRLKHFFAEEDDPVVIEAYESSSLGDLRLLLGAGRALQVFPDASHNDDDPEYWRLIKRDGGHIVVSGHGVVVLE